MSDLSGRLAALTPEQRAQLTAQLTARPVAAQPRPGVIPIAVIGIGCRFPGGANSPELFWQNLCDGVDAIRTTPSDRWDSERFFSAETSAPGKTNSRWGGFLDQVDQFDREFFGLSPREVVHMDPQQRLLLETAWEALEDAGQMTDSLSGCVAGVFIGAQSHSSDYYLMQARHRDQLDTYTATGTAHSILANRLSFLLDLRGPSLAVDTACSSSLVAVHLACQSLRAADCDLAIAGGVNVMLTPDFHICLGKLEMMAPDGRCKTFDHRANGFVRGEGCGVIILKRLPDALRDRDPVLAVIAGSAVNQDGASNGLTAPSGPAQQAVIRRALEVSQIPPEKVGYVETHGTGTALGDPIEIDALASVLSPRGTSRKSCFLGALKTNLGHLEAASGIAGLIKAVLCLKNGSIPRNLHFDRLNPHLSLPESFVLPLEQKAWPRGAEPRIAAVSSFGFGGTNAHVVLSEAPANADPGVGQPIGATPNAPAFLLPISARSAPALITLAASYVEFLSTGEGSKLSPADIAYTASLRRSHHDYRWCVIGTSAAEWAAALRRQVAADPVICPPITQLETRAGDSPIAAPTLRAGAGTHVSMLESLARTYITGGAINWRQLFPANGRCVQLPRYPWQRQRYWLPSSADDDRVSEDRAEAKQVVPTEPPAEWFYEVDWLPRSSLARNSSRVSSMQPVDMRGTANLLAGRMPELERECASEPPSGLRARLDELSADYIWAAFSALGAATSVGSRWSKIGLAGELKVLPRYERLTARLAEILAAAGMIRDDGANWSVVRPPRDGAPNGQSKHLLEKFADASQVLQLHDRCGARLGDVLRGTCDPLSLLFSEDENSSAEAIYRHAAPSRLGNRVAGESLRELVATLPANRTLRILEIGAGTGSTTAALLPMLPAGRCEYVFTDLSTVFLKRAEEKFSEFPFVRYELLDLEQTPAEQGFGHGQFDLIIAANVVHATRDLSVSLQHARQLLAPAGMLLLIECTAPRPWMDITFGLTEGWWRFTDRALRESHPLMHETAWVKLLGKLGFAEPRALPLQQPDTAMFDQAMIIARNSLANVTRATSEPVDRSARVAANYLLFAGSPGVTDALKRQLEARGDRCNLVRPGESFARLGPTAFAASYESADDLRQVCETVGSDCKAVVYIAEVTDDRLEPGELVSACRHPLRVVQALLATRLSPSSGLWLVTRGSRSLNYNIAPALEQSALWGLGLGVALEAPDLSARLVDLDPEADSDGSASALLAEIDDPGSEDQVALRFQQRYVPRLMPATELVLPVAPLRLSGTHFITGGLGGLGSQLAISLAAAGAEHLILIVKHQLPERSRWETLAADSSDFARVAIVRQLEAAGAKVTVAAIDLTDDSSLGKCFDSMDFATLPLRGVWHTAMSLSSSPLVELSLEQVSRMISVKSAAAWRLHELTRAHQLDYFVLFSSTTALWGAAGLAHYAAANAFLDTLAHFRRAKGLPATVINWGTWQQMRGLTTVERDKPVRVGLRPMPAPTALTALQRALAAGKCQTVVADIDWSIFKAAYESRRHQPFLERVGVESLTTASSAQNAPVELLVDRLTSAAADERRELLAQQVQHLVNIVLGIGSDGFVDRQKGFFEMGMDSLTSVQLRRRLEQDLRRPLPSTLTFNYPTVDSLADLCVAGKDRRAVRSDCACAVGEARCGTARG
jgi:3-oxoacyl-(acyl-carrier-protein) synthase/SAM-dependent methyltransferase/short-subunit dehydrogenase/acyl carrier protein